MATTAVSPLPDPYVLMSVLATPAPAGAMGTSWHRYEIRQGVNRIVGYRQGAAESVRTTVEELVVRLNERRISQGGRVHLSLGSASGPADGETAQ